MSRLLDVTVCPDCRARLDPYGTCTDCGLALNGPLAGELWTTMQHADGLVERLRALSRPVPAAPPVRHPVRHPVRQVSAPVGVPPLTPNLPPTLPPTPAHAAPRRRLPAASVPVVLLSLGGLCLLVAAVVFVAVTWSLLGLTGRTLVLVGVTALLAVAAAVLTRKGLRVAAETFWVVVAGMLTLDLLGAQSAGLAGLDSLGWRGTGALVGGSLAGLGVAVGLWARSQAVGRLLGPQVIALVGGLVVTATDVWAASDPAVAAAVAVPVLGVLAVGLLRRLDVTAYGLLTLAGLAWLQLLGCGVLRLAEDVPASAWWAELRGWPLLVASLTAAAVVHLPRVPALVRPFAAGAALLPLTLLTVGPLGSTGATRFAITAALVVAALGLVAGTGPRAWAWGAAPLAALGGGLAGLWVVVAPWPLLLPVGSAGTVGLDAVVTSAADGAPGWTLLVLAVAVVAAAAGLVRLLPAAGRPEALPAVATLAAAVVPLAALALVLGVQPPVWLGVLAGVLATCVAGGGAWWARDRVLPGLVGAAGTAYLAALTVVLATVDDLLLGAVATLFGLLVAGAAARRERAGAEATTVVLIEVGAALGGTALVAWLTLAGVEPGVRAVALAAYAGLLALLAAPLHRLPAPRLAQEAAAAVLALVALADATDGDLAGRGVLALSLLVLAASAALTAVLNRDRVLIGWLAVALTGASTLARLDLRDTQPELWVLPLAALLVGVAVARGSRQARPTGERSTLGSGLAVAAVAVAAIALDRTPTWVSAGSALLVALPAAALFVRVEHRSPVTVTQPGTRDHGAGEALATVVLAVLAGATAGWAVAGVTDLGATTFVAALAAYAGLVGALAAPATRRTTSRVGVEATAALLVLVAAAAAPDLSALAMVLTIAGSAVAVVAVTQRDRSLLSWAAAAVLATATVLRVLADVRAPEVYTLPAALLLVGVGLWRLRTDPHASSLDVMGSGVTLALLPSLLLALDEPVSLRGALVGAAAVLFLALGVQQRLVAPFALGALATAVLAVRHLEPYADAVPRWVSLGGVGVVLLLVGVTWEARRRDLERASRYLVALR